MIATSNPILIRSADEKSCQLALQRFAQFGDCFENPIGNLIRNVFVREINTDLDQSASFDQKLPPFQRLLGQLAARGAQGQLTLSLRLCCKEITQPLDFGKIHPAVQKGPPCELTGFAGLAPMDSSADPTRREITGAPCRCSSATSSPVKL